MLFLSGSVFQLYDEPGPWLKTKKFAIIRYTNVASNVAPSRLLHHRVESSARTLSGKADRNETSRPCATNPPISFRLRVALLSRSRRTDRAFATSGRGGNHDWPERRAAA